MTKSTCQQYSFKRLCSLLSKACPTIALLSELSYPIDFFFFFSPFPPGLIRRKVASRHREVEGFYSRVQLRLEPSHGELQGRAIMLYVGSHHLITMNDFLKPRPFIGFVMRVVKFKDPAFKSFLFPGPPLKHLTAITR